MKKYILGSESAELCLAVDVTVSQGCADVLLSRAAARNTVIRLNLDYRRPGDVLIFNEASRAHWFLKCSLTVVQILQCEISFEYEI